MNSFVAKHSPRINGVLECFDRVILRGHLPIARVGYLFGWLCWNQIALNLKQPKKGWWNFKDAAPWFAETLKAHAHALAQKACRPYFHLRRAERMEENARELARRDGITEGLVCVYGTMETCRTFRVRYHDGGPKVSPDRRVCLVIYFYFMDREFGLMHVKLQTWLPFTVHPLCRQGGAGLAAPRPVRARCPLLWRGPSHDVPGAEVPRHIRGRSADQLAWP